MSGRRKPLTVLTLQAAGQLSIDATPSLTGAQRIGEDHVPWTGPKSFVIDGPRTPLILESERGPIEISFRTRGRDASVSLVGEVTAYIDVRMGEVRVSDHAGCVSWSGCEIKRLA
jgi:hypothetical protein